MTEYDRANIFSTSFWNSSDLWTLENEELIKMIGFFFFFV